MSRKIIHIDMDAYYASIELRDNPELRDLPIVVGGQPGSRGVVATANYEARKFGIRSAMSSTAAQRLCPHVIFVPPRFEAYKKTSQIIRNIFSTFTQLIEPLSLDEAYLDVTEASKKYGSAQALALEIKNKVFRETNLTSSAGVGPNKLIAKIASDFNKPDGITVVSPNKVLDFLGNLPVRKIPGVGPVTEKKLALKKVLTIKTLRNLTKEELCNDFGKTGNWLFNAARGIDEREVQNSRIRKSISVEDTFNKDLLDLTEIKRKLYSIATELNRRLEAIPEKGRTITLKITFADFKKITRSKTLPIAINEREKLYESSLALLTDKSFEINAIRLLGIGLSSLQSGQGDTDTHNTSGEFGVQLSFFL